MNVKEVALKLNKEFKSDKFMRKSDIIPTYKRLHSKAFGMSYPLYGGLPYGRIIVCSGKQHSGKTTAAFAMIADYQKENPDKTCIFVDVEHSVDLQFQFAMHDINQDKLFVMEPDIGMSGEQILSSVLELELHSDDIGMIVIDSIAALDSAQNLENDFEKDNGKRATVAGPLHKFCKEMLSPLASKENILVFVNQVRISGYTYTNAPIYSEPGGDAPKFYSSVSIRFGTRAFMKGDEEIKGENAGEGSDGFRIKFQITKNKTASTSRGGGFITYRYLTGMDWLADLLSIALTFDYIHRVNNVTYELINLETGEPYTDENGKELKGKKADLIDYILSNESFRNTYIQMLQNHISAENTRNINLIDEETAKEIREESKELKDNE